LVKINIGKRPDLTYEMLLGILQKNLTYKIEKWILLGDGISIYKNELLGSIVKIRQKPETTFLTVEVNPPSVIIRILSCVLSLGCFLGCLFILSGNFTKKIVEEIRKIPEFQ